MQRIITILSALFIFPVFLFSQEEEALKWDFDLIDSTAYCIIELNDNSVLTGHIYHKTETEISINTESVNNVTIQIADIENIAVYDSTGYPIPEFWPVNPHNSRHYFAPTAQGLSKGDGYFQSIYLLLISANYGITNNITIGGGLTIIPGLKASEQLYFLNPKISFFQKEKFQLATGVLYLSIPGDIGSEENNILNRNHAGILYGVATYGNKEKNITAGCGIGFLNDHFAKVPVFNIGGMYRTSRRTALVTENWFITSWSDNNYNEYDEPGYKTSAIISYGIRIFGEKMCVDLAFIQAPGEEGFGELFFPGVPYVDFVIKL